MMNCLSKIRHLGRPKNSEPIGLNVNVSKRSSEINQSVPEEIGGAKPFPDDQLVSTLTKREAQVFQYLLNGEKMKDIAGKLGIRTSTVNGYCREVYRKLNVNSKALLILRYSRYRKSGDKQ